MNSPENQLSSRSKLKAGPLLTFAVTATLVLGLAGCGRSESSRADLGTLHVGVLPDQSPSELRLMHEPLIAYLAATTGLDLNLVIPASYSELVQRFVDGDVQLAWFGGLTFLQAEDSARAEPLVMRDVDLDFTTDLLVASSASGRSIEDFAGKAFAFGPRLSTSGHFMPRYFLQVRGSAVEDLFDSTRHSSGHDQTATWVSDGEVDIGAVNSSVVQSMLSDGRLTSDRIRVLWRTPPYRDYVWAVQPDLSPDVSTRLLEAFLALEVALPKHAEILAAQGTGGYLPASKADYEQLRQAVREVGEALGEETVR